eukprot:TRINITY_DN4358_c0_g1_i1.p1 TRINITY_DN4358_c0_g1~~TRINITY_DN4358_c0_g1_i1.p1  ORF type:complete len:204 (-),score=31.60 TRINITY_DN4358_c0_g1_i1:1603-2214(-)
MCLYENSKARLSTASPMERAIAYCQIGRTLMQQIENDIKQHGIPRTPQKGRARKKPVHFPEHLPCSCGELVKEAEKNRQAISFYDVRRRVEETFGLKYAKSTFNAYLRSLGWRHGKCRTSMKHVKGSLEMSAWRARLLRRLRENRSLPEGRDSWRCTSMRLTFIVIITRRLLCIMKKTALLLTDPLGMARDGSLLEQEVAKVG